jgi:predicted RNA binding protein YcfA (HicA-like mRNA interferase family)
MTRLPTLTGRKIIKALEKAGFLIERQTGSCRRGEYAETGSPVLVKIKNPHHSAGIVNCSALSEVETWALEFSIVSDIGQFQVNAPSVARIDERRKFSFKCASLVLGQM